MNEGFFSKMRGIVPNVAHFRAKRISSGHMDDAENVGRELILALLDERFRTIDWDLVREDVGTFVLDDTDITCWDASYFSRKCHELLKVE